MTTSQTVFQADSRLAEMKSSMPMLEPDRGRIYFYRSSSMMGAARRRGYLAGSGVAGGLGCPGCSGFLPASRLKIR
jgi:hypothetical protein